MTDHRSPCPGTEPLNRPPVRQAPTRRSGAPRKIGRPRSSFRPRRSPCPASIYRNRWTRSSDAMRLTCAKRRTGQNAGAVSPQVTTTGRRPDYRRYRGCRHGRCRHVARPPGRTPQELPGQQGRLRHPEIPVIGYGIEIGESGRSGGRKAGAGPCPCSLCTTSTIAAVACSRSRTSPSIARTGAAPCPAVHQLPAPPLLRHAGDLEHGGSAGAPHGLEQTGPRGPGRATGRQVPAQSMPLRDEFGRGINAQERAARDEASSARCLKERNHGGPVFPLVDEPAVGTKTARPAMDAGASAT
ncbi:hypothetical protein SAMN07250955_101131 [Arboricoccus pini]|uniref:Uncharacterized protein n=1 Tax=Arboricoccus pini TaxID=1963835 RepID=A0A212PXK9_9PROT|nr:hypothetical protein SAMN07250955_101131 [Arboricoccus pini]